MSVNRHSYRTRVRVTADPPDASTGSHFITLADPVASASTSSVSRHFPCWLRPLRNTIYVEPKEPYTIATDDGTVHRRVHSMLVDIQDPDHEVIDLLFPASSQRLQPLSQATKTAWKRYLDDDQTSLRFGTSWPHHTVAQGIEAHDETWWSRQNRPGLYLILAADDGSQQPIPTHDVVSGQGIKASIPTSSYRQIRQHRQNATSGDPEFALTLTWPNGASDTLQVVKKGDVCMTCDLDEGGVGRCVANPIAGSREILTLPTSQRSLVYTETVDFTFFTDL